MTLETYFSFFSGKCLFFSGFGVAELVTEALESTTVIPTIECSQECTDNPDFVCDNRNETHLNFCKLELASCLFPNLNIAFEHPGPCIMNETDIAKPLIHCFQNCTENPDLVCDNRNITHLNFCELERASCLFPKLDIKFKRPGPCIEDCHKTLCSDEYDPVCDNKNMTHFNFCMLEKNNCMSPQSNIKFQHSGTCGEN